MNAVWIVDDDRSIRWVLEKALGREGIPYRSFSGVPEALAALAQSEPLVVVSDIRMPGGSGIDLLTELKAHHPGVPVIIMTAYSDLDSAVSAFQGGAFEYMPKPFDVDQALALIRRAGQSASASTMADAAGIGPSNTEMLGQAAAMQEVFRAIPSVSAKVSGKVEFAAPPPSEKRLEAFVDGFEGLYPEGELDLSREGDTVRAEFCNVNVGPEQLLRRLRELAMPADSLRGELAVSVFGRDAVDRHFRLELRGNEVRASRPALWRSE